MAICSSPRPSACRPKGARSGAAFCAISRPPIPARDGRRVRGRLQVLSVTRDGSRKTSRPKRCRTAFASASAAPSQTVPYGPNTYVIRYRTTRQIGFFEKFDELYWNATGTGWTFPIDVAEARITLPEKVDFIQTAILYRPAGRDTARMRRSSSSVRALIVFPHHAAAAGAHRADGRGGVAEGHRHAADSQAQLTRLLAAMTICRSCVGGGGLLAAAWLFRLRLVQGRTRSARPAPIIPLFTPPKDMSAPAVRYVYEMELRRPCLQRRHSRSCGAWRREADR